jgi:hypothetical protein
LVWTRVKRVHVSGMTICLHLNFRSWTCSGLSGLCGMIANTSYLNMINLKIYQSIVGSCRILADTTRPVIAYITEIPANMSIGLRHDICKQSREFYATWPAPPTVVCTTQAIKYRHLPRFRTATGRQLTNTKISNWRPCTVNNVPVHWISIKQPTISLSSSEAEYVAGGHAGRDLT